MTAKKLAEHLETENFLGDTRAWQYGMNIVNCQLV